MNMKRTVNFLIINFACWFFNAILHDQKVCMWQPVNSSESSPNPPSPSPPRSHRRHSKVALKMLLNVIKHKIAAWNQTVINKSAWMDCDKNKHIAKNIACYMIEEVFCHSSCSNINAVHITHWISHYIL